MARYRLTQPAYTHGMYYFAAPVYPVDIEVPDDVAPSRQWTPLDDGAAKALERLTGHKAHVSHAKPPEVNPALATPSPARPRRASDKETL